ncbi:hypothetical protein NKG94_09070 [Micromonospora sp. M12]
MIRRGGEGDQRAVDAYRPVGVAATRAGVRGRRHGGRGERGAQRLRAGSSGRGHCARRRAGHRRDPLVGSGALHGGVAVLPGTTGRLLLVQDDGLARLLDAHDGTDSGRGGCHQPTTARTIPRSSAGIWCCATRATVGRR